MFSPKIIRKYDAKWQPLDYRPRINSTEELPMRRIVLVFGLIAGVIMSAMMLVTVSFSDRIGFNGGWIVGYTSMVLAYLMVYFGIRSYRDNISGGAITFGRAFTVGIGITLIACACYVATWELVYHRFFPDFMDKYAAFAVERTRRSGATPAQIEAKIAEMAKAKEMYKNPLFRIPQTFLEAFPVGLLFTLVSAGMLRRTRNDVNGAPPIVDAAAAAR